MTNKTKIIHTSTVPWSIRTSCPGLLRELEAEGYEGLSLPSVEGMSVGRPFHASDVQSPHEVVNGAGILFPHEDPQALAQETLHLENSPELYKSIANSCAQRAANYDISKMVEGYVQVVSPNRVGRETKVF